MKFKGISVLKKFKISQFKLGKQGSGEGQMMVRWSGEVQVNVSGMSGECQISI